MTDPWLDPPAWAPSWLPAAGDGGVAWLRRAAWSVAALAVVALLLVGAGSPADPFVESEPFDDPTTTTTVPAPVPPPPPPG